MSLGVPPQRDEPLHILLMAATLIAAAFAGAFIGKIWHSAVNEDERIPAEESRQEAARDGAAD